MLHNVIPTCFSLVFPIKPLWREVIKFHYYFVTRTCKLYERIEDERLKLFFDRGASSLRRKHDFVLYARQKPSPASSIISIISENAVRKFSTASSTFGNPEYEGEHEKRENEVGLNLSSASTASTAPLFHNGSLPTQQGQVEKNDMEFNHDNENSEV